MVWYVGSMCFFKVLTYLRSGSKINNMVTSNDQDRSLVMHSQVPSQAQGGPWFLKQRNCGDLRARSQLPTLKRVEGRVEAPGWNQEEGQALVIHSTHFVTPLVLGQATGNSGLTRLTTTQTRGKPPPSPIQYSLRYSTTPTSE